MMCGLRDFWSGVRPADRNCSVLRGEAEADMHIRPHGFLAIAASHTKPLVFSTFWFRLRIPYNLRQNEDESAHALGTSFALAQVALSLPHPGMTLGHVAQVRPTVV